MVKGRVWAWEVEKNHTATIRYSLKERIRASSGQASATSCGLSVVHLSSLQTPSETEAELGKTKQRQQWVLCLRQTRAKEKVLVARALLCFTQGFYLTWCAWINKQFLKRGPEWDWFVHGISVLLSERNLSSTWAPVGPIKARESCHVSRNDIIFPKPA